MYSVILADPPWHYNNRKTGGERKNKTKFGGGAMKHYDLINDKKMLKMASKMLPLISADNCALFMWSTMPRLDFAMECLKAGGFKYVTTAFVWVKRGKNENKYIYGPGYYTASNAEVVLLGIKGKMPPDKKMTPSVIDAQRLEHSQKPLIHHQIDLMYPDRKKIELFARNRLIFPDWDFWGNEI